MAEGAAGVGARLRHRLPTPHPSASSAPPLSLCTPCARPPLAAARPSGVEEGARACRQRGDRRAPLCPPAVAPARPAGARARACDPRAGRAAQCGPWRAWRRAGGGAVASRAGRPGARAPRCPPAARPHCIAAQRPAAEAACRAAACPVAALDAHPLLPRPAALPRHAASAPRVGRRRCKRDTGGQEGRRAGLGCAASAAAGRPPTPPPPSSLIARAQGPAPPNPLVVDRFQQVVSQLFAQRIVRLGGAVDDDMANLVVAQLLYLDSASPADISMYVNSPGGSVTAGMAVFDTMRYLKADASTVCVGLAASMGAFLLASGAQGKRYSLPNARIMIHQPLGGAQGQAADIEIQVGGRVGGEGSCSLCPPYFDHNTRPPLPPVAGQRDPAPQTDAQRLPRRILGPDPGPGYRRHRPRLFHVGRGGGRVR